MARKFNKSDFKRVAEYISDEFSRRKNCKSRKENEKIWKDIDRQLAMVPDNSHKVDETGRPLKDRSWMPEAELPLQSQTLEVLCADARRMSFPDSGPWFTAHAALTDEYLRRVDFQALVAGDEMEVPSKINQDNADKLVEGVINHWHRQYDFFGHWDQINAETFKYGVGIGRIRVVDKNVVLHTARGTLKQTQKIPVLVPRSIKDVYLDDTTANVMMEGEMTGPGQIFCRTMQLKDLQMAAKAGGSKNGWVPGNIKGLEPDKNGGVKLLEFEGDLIAPRETTESFYISNFIITVVQGSDTRVVRVRENPFPFSSYIINPYHREHLNSLYSTAPLMKGWAIQKAAVDALNRLIMVGAINAQPPVGYDKDDPTFSVEGGPRVYPGAQWAGTGDVKVYDIGDPMAMSGIYQNFLAQYYDVTGVNAPRLGAQTVSHTTAYAKQAELDRGVIRTVDYVQSQRKGAFAEYLDKIFYVGRGNLTQSTVYIDGYGGFVTIKKDALPDQVVFDVHGAGGPSEEQQKMVMRMNAAQMAMQVEQLRMQALQVQAQTGVSPVTDYEALIESIYREGGWTDVDAIIKREAISLGTSGQPNMGANPQQVGTSPGAALQALALTSGGM